MGMELIRRKRETSRIPFNAGEIHQTVTTLNPEQQRLVTDFLSSGREKNDVVASDDLPSEDARIALETGLREIERKHPGLLGEDPFAPLGLTLPLVTRADGGKFGKTEQGNVWLDPNRTPPYEFYQFWRNAADADVGKYLKYFTFLPMEQIRELEALQGSEINRAKETLAFEVTRLIHGEDEANRAHESAKKAFTQADVTGEAIPSMTLERSELESGIGLLNLLTRAGLASSNSEARRLVQNGGVRLHDEKVTDFKRTVTDADIHQNHLLLRVGKKKLFRYDVSAS